MVGYNNTKEGKLTQLDYVIAGAGSGFLARMISQPLDVLKIRFQLQVEPIKKKTSSKYQSVYHATSLIKKEEGIKALWKGHVPAQLLSVTYGVAQFWSFEVITRQATNMNSTPSLQPLINFTGGAISGCFATVASFPFDVIRTRLVAQSEKDKIYSGVFQAFRLVIKTEGFFALYRGMVPTFVQIAPQGGVQFMCYKTFNNFYLYLTTTPRTSLMSSLVSGSLAGLVAKTVVYPLDLAKKRLQIQGFERGRTLFGQFFSCRGLNDCLVKIYRVEGFFGLFKGLSPSLLKAICASALYFSGYEMICKFLQKEE